MSLLATSPAPTISEGKPLPANLSRNAIEKVAGLFAERHGFVASDAAKGDLGALVKRLGGKLETSSGGSDGELDLTKEGEFTLWISPYTSWRRDRFTIAHEIGHYVLHCMMGKHRGFVIQRSGSDLLEKEANLFAAALLMPEEEFRAKFAEGLNSDQLATHFQVSLDAVEVRKKILKLS